MVYSGGISKQYRVKQRIMLDILEHLLINIRLIQPLSHKIRIGINQFQRVLHFLIDARRCLAR